MKQIKRRIPSSLYSLPFLVFTFLLIVMSSFLLAVNGFEGLFSAPFFDSPQGILVLVVGPFGLILCAAFFLFGILSESLHNTYPNRFRVRLFIIFCALVFLATFPQTLIVCRYVSTALDSYYKQTVPSSLLAAEDMAALYADERYLTLEKVSKRFFNGLAITNYRSRATDWMSEIRAIDAQAVSAQVYLLTMDAGTATYIPVVEVGDSVQFVPLDRLGLLKNGVFTITDVDTVFRYGQIVRYSNSTYLCVFSSRIPERYQERLDTIKAANIEARIIETVKPFLPLMGIWIYVLFSLPSILMVLVLAWFISARIAEPVRTISEVASHLGQGDYSFIVIPHSKDEIAETANLLNSITDSAVAEKKRDKKAIIRL